MDQPERSWLGCRGYQRLSQVVRVLLVNRRESWVGGNARLIAEAADTVPPRQRPECMMRHAPLIDLLGIAALNGHEKSLYVA